MELIKDLDINMLATKDLDVVLPVTHHFSPGVYIREIFMPKGYIVVGKKHKTAHMNMISKGSCLLLDQDTQETNLIEAPCTFESKGMTNKVLYIIEDCVWSNIHITNETDLQKLEEQLIVSEDIIRIGD